MSASLSPYPAAPQGGAQRLRAGAHSKQHGATAARRQRPRRFVRPLGPAFGRRAAAAGLVRCGFRRRRPAAAAVRPVVGPECWRAAGRAAGRVARSAGVGGAAGGAGSGRGGAVSRLRAGPWCVSTDCGRSFWCTGTGSLRSQMTATQRCSTPLCWDPGACRIVMHTACVSPESASRNHYSGTAA